MKIKKIILKYSNRFISKWFILLLDVLLVSKAFYWAYVLRFNFEFDRAANADSYKSFPFLLSVYLLSFFIFKPYTGVVRHTSLKDAERILKSVSLSFLVVFTVSIGMRSIYGFDHILHIPGSIVVVHYLLTIFLMLGLRFAIKMIYFTLILENSDKNKPKVLIFGAGQSGLITRNTLSNDRRLNCKIVGFIDDNSSKIGKYIDGIHVYSADQVFANDFLEKKHISMVVISVQKLSADRKREIVDECLKHNVKVKTVPAVKNWINGELSANQIKDIRIDDLLGRDIIKLDKKNIKKEVNDKVVLVTGAAGSIGSEIVRQLCKFRPKQILLFDQAESPLYDLEYDIKLLSKNNPVNYTSIIGDVTSHERLEEVFKLYNPDLVFHAAAYKHVPLVEANPTEGVMVNVFGTKNLADLSVKYGAEKFVLVSTDKAVNPTNVMGATKRMAEIYIQSLNFANKAGTKFVTTRFGNVLGSNGSVIPLFKKQIADGGPVLVTHPEITRYFMTIPEACQLVLEAGAMGNGGEIYVFDMGESVKIVEIAKKMIRLSGLELGKDIEIEFTGLRPGEKLYEELLNNKENTRETHHPKIMIGAVREYNYDEVNHQFNTLLEDTKASEVEAMICRIKQLIPEYISQNSEFAKFDSDKVKTV